jgi:hypothetical protein
MGKRLLLGALLSLGLFAVGCGDDGDDGDNKTSNNNSNGGDGDGDGDKNSGTHDNVKACNDWKAAVQCSDLSSLNALDCGQYANVACDISAYFDCLTDNTKCNNDVLDVSGWGACASMVSCH